MIPACDALRQLRQRARVSAPIQRNVLHRLTRDIVHDGLYVIGHDSQRAADLLADDDRRVYGYFCAKHEQLNLRRPRSFGFYGSFAGEMTWDMWALIVSTIESCAIGQAGNDNVSLDSVLIPTPAWSSLLITAAGNHLEPLFLFRQDLSPLQGFALLNEAILANRNEAEQQFINRQEYPM